MNDFDKETEEAERAITAEKTDSLLERSPYGADNGADIGRNPRTITAEEWEHWPEPLLVGLRAIRAKCIDCALSAIEVRKCVCTNCPLWPMRMGSVPWAYKKARDRLAGCPTQEGSTDQNRPHEASNDVQNAILSEETAQ